MKEKPILFSAPMVRAILDGRKTQTRRVVDCPPDTTGIHYVVNHETFPHGLYTGWVFECGAPLLLPRKCPYGKPGDSLWVRENFSIHNLDKGYQNPDIWDDFRVPSCIVQYADGDIETRELIVDSDMGFDDVAQAERATKKKTVPSIHMPRWASRIDLLIKAVRVERLQDINGNDAVAEGVASRLPENGIAQSQFQDLWTIINGPESWYANPWVWVVEFERVKP